MKFVFVLLFCQLSLASFPLIRVDNASGSLRNSSGHAFIDRANYVLNVVTLSHDKININLSKPDKNLIIKDTNTSVKIDFDFSFLETFNSFDFYDLDLLSKDYDFKISIPRTKLLIKNSYYNLSQLEVSTFNNKNEVPRNFTILRGLIRNAKLTLDSLTFGQKFIDDEFLETVRHENNFDQNKLNEIFFKDNKLVPIRSVDKVYFESKEGDFTLNARIDTYLNFGLYIGGKLTKRVEEGQTFLDMDIFYAKMGYFSIRKILLKQVRNLNLKNVTVNGSRITLAL